jgi:hypothetical protein
MRINKNKIKVSWWYLNMNNFISVCKLPGMRNKLKQKYHEIIKELAKDIDPIRQPVKVLIIVHGKSRAKFDVGNVGSIVEKFTLDGLVEAGILEDDDYTHVPAVEYRFGGRDAENPTADFYLLPYDENTRSEYMREGLEL